jgi:hydrogenase/urease accessory protein HupE
VIAITKLSLGTAIQLHSPTQFLKIVIVITILGLGTAMQLHSPTQFLEIVIVITILGLGTAIAIAFTDPVPGNSQIIIQFHFFW